MAIMDKKMKVAIVGGGVDDGAYLSKAFGRRWGETKRLF
jgi:hypothetical protein